MGGPCENLIARMVLFDQNNQALPFAQPDGKVFQCDLTLGALAALLSYPTPTPHAPTPTITPRPGLFVIDARTQPDPPLRNVDEAQSAGHWKLGGGGPCEDFVVRATWFDQNNYPVFFTTFDGKVFEKTITVCP